MIDRWIERCTATLQRPRKLDNTAGGMLGGISRGSVRIAAADVVAVCKLDRLLTAYSELFLVTYLHSHLQSFMYMAELAGRFDHPWTGVNSS